MLGYQYINFRNVQLPRISNAIGNVRLIQVL